MQTNPNGKPDPFAPEYKDYKVTKLPQGIAINYSFFKRETHLLPKPAGHKVSPNSRAE
jgi:hypothetical protein